MRFALFTSSVAVLVLIAMATGAPISSAPKPQYEKENAPALFKKFKTDFNRQYKDEADEKVHYEAFVKSLETIIRLNAKQSSATYDINKFADYTDEERKHLTGTRLQ